MTSTRDDIVEVFECHGNFSFLHELHLFSFKIYKDKSLQVVIKPIAIVTQSIDQQELIQDINNREQVDDHNENVPRRSVATGNEPPVHVVDDEINTKLAAYDGRALVQKPHVAKDGIIPPVNYIVHFKIVQYGRHAQGMRSQIVKCIAHLSRDSGMSGRFVEVNDSVEEGQDFTLRPSSYRIESLANPLHPLTPGRYILQGIAIAENAFVYECLVDLTLQASGMMSGTSCELPFAQECPLAGMWTRNGLYYVLQYEMHGNKHTYNYFGTPFHAGLQGTWQNSELPGLEVNLDAHSSQAERGMLEFQLVKAVRVWSEAFHKDYPVVFQECVKIMLLASHRNGSLPNHLWSSIVSYCGYNWFQSDLQ